MIVPQANSGEGCENEVGQGNYFLLVGLLQQVEVADEVFRAAIVTNNVPEGTSEVATAEDDDD